MYAQKLDFDGLIKSLLATFVCVPELQIHIYVFFLNVSPNLNPSIRKHETFSFVISNLIG